MEKKKKKKNNVGMCEICGRIAPLKDYICRSCETGENGGKGYPLM